ncbi:atherin-like [Mastomys coucha]|uniref:atherin-like n=1 Tax=Mastomys coucha TaxID=35658 RepID=UPI001261F95E|nr:atherin-like [Mastomys coucha]
MAKYKAQAVEDGQDVLIAKVTPGHLRIQRHRAATRQGPPQRNRGRLRDQLPEARPRSAWKSAPPTPRPPRPAHPQSASHSSSASLVPPPGSAPHRPRASRSVPASLPRPPRAGRADARCSENFVCGYWKRLLSN